jgi:hypothetical protein
MAQSPQTYKSHRRLIPIYHFFVTPVLVLNVFAELLRLNKYRTPYHVWLVIVAIALVILAFAVRSMATRVQDRVIRLEERARLGALLPPDMRDRVNDLTTSQLVGLRFASDEEVTDLARRCLAGELTKGEQIKKEVKSWRPDYLRA